MSQPDTPHATISELKRVYAFFDGQNLFHAARREFGSTEADYDPLKLAQAVCERESNWQLDKVYFYTGIPDKVRFRRLYLFWVKKLEAMRWARIEVHKRDVIYRWEQSPLYDAAGLIFPDGSFVSVRDPLILHSGETIPYGTMLEVLVGSEKGIDIKIGVDVLRLAFENKYDVALIFSQDNDLVPVADEIRLIAKEKSRDIKIASAFPCAGGTRSRGIEKTDWKPIDKKTYTECIDPKNYWPPR